MGKQAVSNLSLPNLFQYTPFSPGITPLGGAHMGTSTFCFGWRTMALG